MHKERPWPPARKATITTHGFVSFAERSFENMKTAIFSPEHEDVSKFGSPEAAISFRPYFEHIVQCRKRETTVKGEFYQAILNEFEKYPELKEPVQLEDIHRYETLLEYMYATLSDNMLADEKDRLWGLSAPLRPVFFYSTDALYNIVSFINAHQLQDNVAEKELHKEERIASIYACVFDKLFNFQVYNKSKRVRSVTNPKTGLKKYFQLNFDIRFLEVHANGPLPKLSFEEIQPCFHDAGGLESLLELFPPALFRFEGFSVITLSDVTAEYVLEYLKESLIHQSLFGGYPDPHYSEVVESLKILVGTNEVEFGLLPFITVNNKPVFNKEMAEHSALIGPGRENDMDEATIISRAEQFQNNPHPLYFKSVAEGSETEGSPPYLSALSRSGIYSFALVPVFYHKKLTGVLEVYAKKPDVLTESVLARLEQAIPLIVGFTRTTSIYSRPELKALLRKISPRSNRLSNGNSTKPPGCT